MTRRIRTFFASTTSRAVSLQSKEGSNLSVRYQRSWGISTG